MAKNKSNRTVRKSANRRPRRRRNTMIKQVRSKEEGYLALLNDPCNAPTQLDAGYTGEQGYVQRFLSDLTVNTGVGSTSGYALFHPNSNLFASTDLANPASTTAINLGIYQLSPSPGNLFLAGSAAKIRSLAACMSFTPSAVSLTNMTGEIAVGNLSLNSTIGTYSPNTLFTLLPARYVLNKRQYDVKLVPGAFEDRYSVYNDGTTIDTSDTNVICIAWRGCPAGSAMSIRLTNVVEWTPKLATGLPASNALRHRVDHHSATVALQTAKPDWWHKVANAAEHVGSTVWQHGGKQIVGFASQIASQKAAQYVLEAAGSSILAL